MNSQNDHAQVVINPFFVYIGLGLCAAALERWLPLPIRLPDGLFLFGALMLLFSLGVGLPAVRNMIAARTSPNPNQPTSVLIFSGPYRFSRNPMYLGLTLIYAGMVIFFHLLWGLLLLPIAIWLITIWVIVPEEKYLEQKFGTPYTSYKAAVRRWV